MATGFRLGDPREYRRGVILGLTLAEVLVLLAFLLLLAMSALLLRRDQERAQLVEQLNHYDAQLKPLTDALISRGVTVEDTEQLASLIERGSAADTLRSELSDLARKLDEARATQLQQQAELNRMQEGARSATDLQKVVAEHQAIVALLERMAGPAAQPLPERVEAVMRKAATVEAASVNLTGQNAQMRTELARLKGNGGSGLPYCWALLNGRSQEMLKVEMQDTGVIVRDLEPRARPDDAAWGLLGSVSRDRLMPLSEFVAQTSALQARSATERCRYAIQVVDGTGVTNKPGYKQSMGRLWSVFMLREVPR